MRNAFERGSHVITPLWARSRLAATATALVAAAFIASPAVAQLDLSGAIHASTLGYGLEGDILLTPHIGARVIYNGALSLNKSLDNSGVTYDATADFKNIPIWVDFYPSARGNFHLTGGIILNQNKITVLGVPDAGGTFDLNGVTYQVSEIGTLVGGVNYPSQGWYAGFGWGTPVRTGSRIGFVCDIGAFFSTPTVTLSAPNANPILQPQLDQNLQAQADSTQASLQKYAKIYPVISLGINVKF
jgi:hypothetical protein